MSQLSFWRAGVLLAQIDDAEPGDMLLDVARFHDVPLHWRCGQGTCGTCAVRIRHAAQPREVMVGRKERNVLLRAGLIDAAMAARDSWPDAEATPRLACHLALENMAWHVLLPEDN